MSDALKKAVEEFNAKLEPHVWFRDKAQANEVEKLVMDFVNTVYLSGRYSVQKDHSNQMQAAMKVISQAARHNPFRDFNPTEDEMHAFAEEHAEANNYRGHDWMIAMKAFYTGFKKYGELQKAMDTKLNEAYGKR